MFLVDVIDLREGDRIDNPVKRKNNNLFMILNVHNVSKRRLYEFKDPYGDRVIDSKIASLNLVEH